MPSSSSRLVRFLGSPAFLIFVLVLATTLRVWHVFELRQLPLFDRLIVDSEKYDTWAQQIAAGDWLGVKSGRPFYQDPLYSYVLAVVYKVVGRDLMLVRLLQVACGVATIGLVAVLGRQLRDAAAGNVGALLLAVYRPAIFQEGEFEKTALSVLLAMAALVLFLRASPRSKLLSGVLLGLAALTRANLLLMAPFAAGYLAVKREWKAAGLFVLGAALAIAPATWRNHHVSGEWILTASGMGQNFYTGNNPGNPDGAYRAVPFVRPQTAHEEGDFLREAERRVGHPVTAHEASSYWFRETLRGMAARPVFAATVLVKKLGLFWSEGEVPDAWDMPFIARYSLPLRLPLISFSLLLALAVVGAWPALRTEAGRIVAAWVVLYGASVVAFFVFSRYRLHVVPPMAAFAGVGLIWAGERVRLREYRALVVPVAVALLAFAFSATAFPSYRREVTNSSAALAELYQERGDFVSARRALGDALGREPGDARLLCAMAKLSLRDRDAAGALEFATRAVAANPYVPDGWYVLGLAREASGDAVGAQAAYRRQLEIVPGHEAASKRLRR